MNISANQWIVQGIPGVIIIGNGPGEMPKFERDRPFIRFNLSDDIPLSPMEVRVSNRRAAKLSSVPPVFQVQSQWMKDTERERLQYLLAKQVFKLGTELGCLPSTGLATVHACIELGLSVQVFRMPLRPALFRAPELAPRQPLAAAFHNWLGEQRVAWRLIASQGDQLSWLDMVAKHCAIAGETEGRMDPYPRIFEWMQIASMGGPDSVDPANLVELAIPSKFDWEGYAKHECLQQLEPFFYLDRTKQKTPNWWLYSNALSITIDTLLGRLTQAQRFLHTKQAAS
jgi:hypothetical protein